MDVVCEKIIEIIDTQIFNMRLKNIEPNRIILGINLYNYLYSRMKWYDFQKVPFYEYRAVIFGLPVSVDIANKNLIMVSVGDELEFDLDNNEAKFKGVKLW